jgi:hypothetical protein
MRLRTWFIALGTGFILAFFAFWVNQPIGHEPTFGVTFSTVYARQLGINWQEAFIALLDELQVSHIRIPAYWSEQEPSRGAYRFDDTDWMLREADARGVRVTLVVGRKVPRWPECFVPDWAETLETASAENALLNFLEQMVRRYRDAPALERWQVENEPFFPFGVCPAPSRALLDREVALVRSLDARPIMLTVSGEIDPWADMASRADVLGISMYRITWNPWVGFFSYPLSPAYYRARVKAVSSLVDRVVVSELQAEPWLPKPLSGLSLPERAALFTPHDLKNHVEFARRVGLSEVYLWGVEWWYAQRELGDASLWEEAKKIFEAEH